ncbi:hypothetical protein [Epilithonimonas vandammei]|uniref:hypothetical protein n=1 Tax=Epilithonimonas vandammei TaxID=2487072 RepID=UPI002898B2E1|nr:hypothetical protein [Epilithonimonas vandammei]
MKTKFKAFFSFVVFFFVVFQVKAQARLTVENNSQRSMTVKVMKGTGKGTLHKTVTISSFGSETIYFSESGQYFTKTKAVLKGKDPVYQKGQPFQVTNDETGYSVMTLTFSITESSIPQITGGKQISKSEFDQN